MRSVIRPALVGIAAVGMAFVGAASAQACDHHDPSTVTVTNTEIEHSFNKYFSDNFQFGNNNNVVFGDQTIGDED